MNSNPAVNLECKKCGGEVDHETKSCLKCGSHLTLHVRVEGPSDMHAAEIRQDKFKDMRDHAELVCHQCGGEIGEDHHCKDCKSHVLVHKGVTVTEPK
jgi:hypothetical protein